MTWYCIILYFIVFQIFTMESDRYVFYSKYNWFRGSIWTVGSLQIRCHPVMEFVFNLSKYIKYEQCWIVWL